MGKTLCFLLGSFAFFADFLVQRNKSFVLAKEAAREHEMKLFVYVIS